VKRSDQSHPDAATTTLASDATCDKRASRIACDRRADVSMHTLCTGIRGDEDAAAYTGDG
jgi:hypothetical protein